jgi:rhodanese-related sulfurtransferase
MNIDATELNSRLSLQEDLRILDVREELEFHTFNIGGQNIPLGKIPESEDLEFSTSEEIIVVCQRGIRSKTACKILQSMGYSKARNLSGGLLALRRLNS